MEAIKVSDIISKIGLRIEKVNKLPKKAKRESIYDNVIYQFLSDHTMKYASVNRDDGATCSATFTGIKKRISLNKSFCNVKVHQRNNEIFLEKIMEAEDR